MRNDPSFIPRVNIILDRLNQEATPNAAVEVANEIIKLLGNIKTKSVEEVFESSIELPNAERYDSWFQPHPIFKSERACFELTNDDSELVQAKFYWLKKRSRQFIAGGVHFSPNFEDEDYTRNNRYKVGIDFFLSPNGKSLQVVLSNRGNLRVVELNRKLNNTQVDIFAKWEDVGMLAGQEAIHTSLWESFRLKTVNERFYAEIANNFTLLTQHLKTIDKDEEEAKLFASRLLGRLLFCWFLRKKGIIDESIGYFKAKGSNATDYYRGSLERLFFLTLNTPIDERDELHKQHQKQLFPDVAEEKQPSLFKTDQKTPYLNGGLFEPHENDWFQDEKLTFPEGFFVNLYSHFEEFNFTTDESSPEYEQIAIDPEMLGRVFESLLATQVDETGKQARKAKGAFYTPREIVSYMCKESLRNYLYNTARDNEDIRLSVDSLLDISDSEWAKSKSNTLRDKVKDYRTQIIDALDTLTVLDPACGSGAYPMGMLQLCVKTYERLEGRFDPYKTKLQIIQNNIFGVDIEPMAVEIARLRAWLSLIVDEEESRGVEPLPNLDFKFVCANSLVPLDEVLSLFSDTQLHQKLKDIRNKYFNARKPHTKKAIQDDYYNLTKSNQTPLIADDLRTTQLKSFDPFKNSHPAEFLDLNQMFGTEEGFDLVIGNPPYIHLESMKELSKTLYKPLGFKTYEARGDIYALFYERGVSFLKQGGFLSFITSNKWMRAGYGKSLRNFLINDANPIQLIDLGGGIFDSATVDTNILLVQRSRYSEDTLAVTASTDFNIVNMSDYIRQNSTNIFFKKNESWAILSPIEQSIKAKIEAVGTPLKDWDININYGIKTGCNEAFIINKAKRDELIAKDPKSAEIIRPILRGRDINRYQAGFKDIYVIASHNGYIDTDGNTIPRIDIEDYPVIKAHLDEHWDKVVLRSDQGDTPYNLRSCGYMDDFNRQYLAWSDISTEPQFALVNEGSFINNTAYMISGDSLDYLLHILNSKLIAWYFPKIASDLGSEGVRYFKQFVEILPVPKYTGVNLEQGNDLLIYERYGLREEEIKFVEDSLK